MSKLAKTLVVLSFITFGVIPIIQAEEKDLDSCLETEALCEEGCEDIGFECIVACMEELDPECANILYSEGGVEEDGGDEGGDEGGDMSDCGDTAYSCEEDCSNANPEDQETCWIECMTEEAPECLE